MHFAGKDQKQRQYCICYKMSSALYRKYGTVVNKYSIVALINRGKKPTVIFPMHICDWI